MTIDYVSIGKTIRQFRMQKGWKQAKLAEESKTEPSNISHIERGATKVSLPTLLNIANALEVSLDELVYGSLVKSGHVSNQMIEELLSDCSRTETQGLVEILIAAKRAMRRAADSETE